MKKPVPKPRPKGIRRYDSGGSVSSPGTPVDPSSISRGVQSGMSTALQLMQMKNSSGNGGKSGGGGKPSGGDKPSGGGGSGSDNTNTPDTGSAPASTPSSSMGAQMDMGVPGGRKGGVIRRVAGKPIGKDDGLIAAQRGEYVVRKAAVNKLGTKVLNQVNKGKLPTRGRHR